MLSYITCMSDMHIIIARHDKTQQNKKYLQVFKPVQDWNKTDMQIP